MLPFSSWFRGVHHRRRRLPFRPTLESLEFREVLAASVTTIPIIYSRAGTPFSGLLATFRDSSLTGANPAAALANLHATIYWGDGQTSDGTIAGPDASGTLTVSGSHNYQQGGSLSAVVTVTDNNDHTWDAAGIDMEVKAPPIVLGLQGDAQNIHTTQGQLFSGLVALVKDNNPQVVPDKLAVELSWGDGTPPVSVAVTGPNQDGLFEVRASHVFTQAGTFTLNLSLHDSNAELWATTTATATVLPAPQDLTVTGVNLGPTAGLSFSRVVALIHDPAPGVQPGNLQASITWGDGTALTEGTVVAAATPGYFEVHGSHLYAQSGTDQISVMVEDTQEGTSATSTSTATVQDPTGGLLNATGVAVAATAGQPVSQVVAIINDGDATASAANLQVAVNWGDGTGLQMATVQATAAGNLFQVMGNHVYSQAGTYQITMWLQDMAAGKDATASTTAVVQDAPPPPPPPPPPPAPPPVVDVAPEVPPAPPPAAPTTMVIFRGRRRIVIPLSRHHHVVVRHVRHLHLNPTTLR